MVSRKEFLKEYVGIILHSKNDYIRFCNFYNFHKRLINRNDIWQLAEKKGIVISNKGIDYYSIHNFTNLKDFEAVYTMEILPQNNYELW